MLKQIKKAVASFLERTQLGSDAEVVFFDNPTEEIEGALAGKDVNLHWQGVSGRGMSRGASKRAEENYLYSTRRFPQATNNVLPAPTHIPAGDYLYFSVPLGNDGSNMGYASGLTLGLTETNIETASQVPQGKAFRMKQVGVSFSFESKADDIEQLCDAGSLVFTKQGGQWSLRHGPVGFWPGGMGVSGFTQNQGTESAHNGIADWKAARFLKIPRDIHNLENFNYVYHVDRGARASDGTNWQLSQFTQMRVWLWGLQMDKIPD